MSYETICFPFLFSHFYLHKSTFINSQRLESDHRDYQERMREYKYKIATMRSRIALLELYRGGCVTRLIGSGWEIGGGGER